jgi:hypothetical protein
MRNEEMGLKSNTAKSQVNEIREELVTSAAPSC